MIREVNAAISALISGAQSATVSTPSGTRSYTRPQLNDLRTWRKELMGEYSRANVRKRVGLDFS